MKKALLANKFILILFTLVFLGFVSMVAILEIVNASFNDKIYPGVYINNIALGGQTKDQAINTLTQSTSTNPDKINLIDNNTSQVYEIPLNSINYSPDINQTVEDAFNTNRSKNRISNFLSILRLNNSTTEIPLEVNLNQEALDTRLSVIAEQTTIAPVYPSAKIESGEVVINSGKSGSEINTKTIKNQILSQLEQNNFQSINLNIAKVDPSLTTEEIQTYTDLIAKYIGKSIKVTNEYLTINIADSEIASFINPDESINQEALTKRIENIASQVDREPQNSIFVFESGKVKEFTPSKDGLKVNQQDLNYQIVAGIEQLQSSEEKEVALAAPVESTKPEVTNDQVNNLGINELIGRGTSRYRGSIPSRVHNVALATSYINGHLVKPGETFSFNEALGDVSALTGYKQAYVIKDGKTVLGDGGGVCQVSTTLFRAALDAGLPIVERQGHSYRVGYYEQDAGPGLDATVYGPHPDLRIVNNTPATILIQATADSKNTSLVFEIYGTDDGRVATTTKPVMSNVAAPAEDLYVDDPTIPTGQIKQIEHKAWGGKSTFSYEVKDKDGKVTYQKNFVTNYRPWQAVYLRGTGPAI